MWGKTGGRSRLGRSLGSSIHGDPPMRIDAEVAGSGAGASRRPAEIGASGKPAIDVSTVPSAPEAWSILLFSRVTSSRRFVTSLVKPCSTARTSSLGLGLLSDETLSAEAEEIDAGEISEAEGIGHGPMPFRAWEGPEDSTSGPGACLCGIHLKLKS